MRFFATFIGSVGDMACQLIEVEESAAGTDSDALASTLFRGCPEIMFIFETRRALTEDEVQSLWEVSRHDVGLVLKMWDRFGVRHFVALKRTLDDDTVCEMLELPESVFGTDIDAVVNAIFTQRSGTELVLETRRLVTTDEVKSMWEESSPNLGLVVRVWDRRRVPRLVRGGGRSVN